MGAAAATKVPGGGLQITTAKELLLRSTGIEELDIETAAEQPRGALTLQKSRAEGGEPALRHAAACLPTSC